MIVLKYGIAGSLAVGTHLLILQAGIYLGVNLTVATSVGFIVGCCVNYALQRSWVFQYKAQTLTTFSRYVIVTGIMCVVNMILFNLLLRLPIGVLVAQVFSTLIVMFANFAINSRFTFARHSRVLKA